MLNHIAHLEGSKFCKTLTDWLREHFVYAEDQPVEILRTPENMINCLDMNGYFVGDCDDATIFACYIAFNIGIPCRMVAISEDVLNPNFTHVYTEILDKDGWQQVDPTVDPHETVMGIRRMEVLV